jgi:hypothetical protein
VGEVDEVVVVVGLCVRKREAGGGAGGQIRGRRGTKPSAMARFRARRVKRRWRVMGGGGGVWWMRWWRWWGCAFANARQERGWGPKPQNRAIVARFWAAFEQQVVEWGAVGL